MSDSIIKSPLPPEEENRVRAVHDLRVLDTEREHRFDSLVAELARKLDVPIAYLGLIAQDRQWIKAKVGPIPTEASRADAFCSRTILGDEPVLVADASQDPRFAASSLVRDAPHLRFYAGIPISDRKGHNVGTVCVADLEPREITPRDLAILEGFADRLEAELNTRQTVLLAYASEDEELIGRFVASDPRLDDPAVVDLWSSHRSADERSVWKLKDALWRARSAVLMASPAFLRSAFVQDRTFQRQITARELDEFATTVVQLEPCDWAQVEWLAGRPLWPANDQAITIGSEAEIDRLFRDLAIELVGEPPTAPEATPATAAPGKEGVQVFLSHAGEDAAAVKDLAGRLRQAGVNVWLDVDELRPGDDWMEALEKALDSSDAFAVYIGRSGIARWIGREVRVALDRNAKDPRFRVIPILGPGSDPEALPRFVRQHHWLDLREGDPQPAEIRKLVASILSRPAEAVSLLPAGEPPFRGLLTFGAEHAHLFFGRDQETAELVEILATSPFLAVIGDSGSGKSSLVRAGLVPALHRGHFRDAASTSATWQVAVIKPGSDPFRELASGLLDLLPESAPAERMATLKALSEQLGSGTEGLCNALSALRPKGERTLLVIDQFEEIFTQCQDPDERDRFIDTLLAASNCEGDRPLHTIVTLRADFYSRCFEHPTLPKVLSSSLYPVRAIPSEKLAEVIEKPAMLAGIQLEPGLVQAILFDLGEGPGHLPLLEHTLLQLWKLRTGETLTHSSYQEIGRVQGALEHHAEEVYRKFDEPEKQAARKLLLSLVLPTENAGPARRRAKIDKILPAGESRKVAEAVLARLVDERLLVVRGSSGRGGGPSEEDTEGDPKEHEIEVTHEALLRGWRRLGGWLETDREFLFWRQRVNADFEKWRASERDAGALLRGAPLAEAERWLNDRGEDLSEDGRSFIQASIALEQRRRWKERAVTAVIGVFALVAVAFWLNARHAQKEAEKSLVTAMTAVDKTLTRVGSESLKDVPQLEEVRQELLSEAEALYRRLSEQETSASVSELRLRTTLVPARKALVQQQMDQREAAMDGLTTAIAGLRALVNDEPNNRGFQFELAKILNQAGWLITDKLGRVGTAEEAADSYQEALTIHAALVKAEPANVEYAYELAETHLNRGILRAKLDEFEDAKADYDAASKSVDAFASQGNEDASQQLARSHNQLAALLEEQAKALRDQGKHGEATEKYREAVEEYKEASRVLKILTDKNKKNREYQQELAKVDRNLAHLLKNADPRQAEEYSRNAVDLNRGLADALPGIREEWARALRTYGRVQAVLKNREQAAESLIRASQLFAELIEPDKPSPDFRYEEAVTLLYLADLRAEAGETDELAAVWAELEKTLQLLPAAAGGQITGSKTYERLQALVDAGRP